MRQYTRSVFNVSYPCLMQEESKPSPLTLLARTCNSIGRDSNSTSTSSSSSAAAAAEAAGRKSKSAEDVKTSLSSPSLEVVRSGQSQTEVDSKAITETQRLQTSPALNVVVSSSSAAGAAARTLSMADFVRSAGRSSSPAVKTLTPPTVLAVSTSPTRHRASGTDAGKTATADYWPLSCAVSDPDGQYAMQYLAAVAALQRQSVDPAATLLPFLAAQRLQSVHPLTSHCPDAAGDRLGRLKPGSCSDPCCSRCLHVAAAAVAASSRGAGCVVGCSQCGSHPVQPAASSTSSTSTSSVLLPPGGGHGAFAAALSALCRLPAPPDTAEPSVVGPSSTLHTCNWLHQGGAYCGRRFSSVDELMQHLHSHCDTTADQASTSLSFPSADLHPVAAGSLFAPLAVLYGASSSSSSYPAPLDLLPPPGAIPLPSTTGSPPSSLLRHHQHSLAFAAAAAASRYHPYRVAASLLPPSAASAAYPSSLAAYYGALCGMAPPSNGTVPVVRL